MRHLATAVRRALSWRLGRPPLRDPLEVLAEAHRERVVVLDFHAGSVTEAAGVTSVELVSGDELFDLRSSASTVALRGLSP